MEWSHLAAIVGYLIACYVLLIFVTVPLSVVAVALGILCAIVVALYQIGVVSFGRHAGPISTPRAVADRPLSRRRQMRFVRRDRAWPIFVASQVWLDVGAVGERCVAAIEALITGLVAWVVRTFHRVAGTKRSKRHIAWAWPVLLPLGMFALGFGAGVIMTWLLYVLVAAMAWLATQLLVVVASTAMRLTDWIWQRMYRASGSCPICYQVTSTPAFQCNGNHHPNDVRTPERYDLHFDLRPGQLGVLWRTCECGALLPTMVQRAAGQLQPFCPTCRAPMHRGAGSATDVRIPVFGAPSVGKTHLVMAGMVSLVQVAAAHQVPAEPADDYSRGQFENYRQVVDGARAVAKTPDRPPIASTLRIGSPSELSWWARARRSRQVLVHVFDAGGEPFVSPSRPKYWYLDLARTLVLVLDPFSLATIREVYAAGFPAIFERANASSYDPRTVYRATVSQLRHNGVLMKRKRLAFVVSKADLLAQLPGQAGIGTDSTSIRAWLCQQGLDDLLTAVEQDFGEVRYFLVSALAASSTDTATNLAPGSALAPFLWLLSTEHIDLGLPTRPASVV